MYTNYKAIATSFILFLMATLVPSVSAYTTCTTQYGGNEVCQSYELTINKQVKNPATNVYVENLTTTDPTFAPGADVMYRLIIKNESTDTLNPITVRDTLPAYLEFVSGPGSYNADTRVLEFKLDNVTANETRTVEVLARVVPADKFPTGKSLFCVVNFADASALNRQDSDSAQVCLQNGEVARNLPVAGFNDLMILLPFAGVGLGGVALLKGKKRS